MVFATPDQRVRVSALRDALEESDLPFRVDLFVWDDIPEAFLGQIERDHVVLERQESHREDSEWGETTLGAVTKFLSGGTAVEGSTGILERLDSLGVSKGYEALLSSRY